MPPPRLPAPGNWGIVRGNGHVTFSGHGRFYKGIELMTDFLKRCWAVVDLDAIAHNFQQVRRRLAPTCLVMAVVKADAYSHGDRYVASELARQGANWFGVSNIDEAISLRRQGIYQPILILGSTPAENAALLGRYAITQTIFSAEYARELQQQAALAGVTLDVHIKVDTGMSRLGFAAAEEDQVAAAAEEIAGVCALENLRAYGIFTHFSCADEKDPGSEAFTRRQYALFLKVIAALSDRGIEFPLRHCCNSAAVLRYPEMQLDMVRPGVILYGLAPSPDCEGLADLKPAMSLHCVISMVKELKAGCAVSYGRTFTAPLDMRIATVPIGYADGFDRRLSNNARMLLHGQYAPVVGSVCMDQLMLDVTHIPDARAGDEVTIIGAEGERAVTFDEMAARLGTINYEKMCLIGKRVPRLYRRGGEDLDVVDYVRQAVREKP